MALVATGDFKALKRRENLLAILLRCTVGPNIRKADFS
jgi:hypothetical protein